MTMTTYSIRMDDNLKAQFDALCENIGLSVSTAFNIFAKKAVSKRALPIDLSENIEQDTLAAMAKSRKQAIETGSSNLSLDDINAEIDAYRAGKREQK